ncbi:histidine kinase [Malaciobacter molluscorum]|uniref:ABC transporter substrate-binding protein n=1 Tax=Malaciobacter molluscorum TaxID=1032072 RepID=UPI00100AFD24|nr:ABC transporter substrate-binding protein [Malaciobacter molluscorum]RXJ91949.1 histidine kinase [Malaciobacter molluscorum]
MQSIIKKLIILFCFITFSNLYSKDLDKVSLQLSWFNQFQFAGYYIAKEKDFYKDVGLDVDIKNYDFNIDVPTEVSNGNSNFGIGRETLLLDKSEGKDVVSLYATFQASPLVLISLKNSNIESIKDFENKKIMATPGDATEVSIKAMITSKNIDFKKMIFLKHSHNVMDLVNKKTDIMSAYISKAPYSLDKKNIKYNIFYPKDYGFDMYSDFLFTNSHEIKNNEQRVIDFKNASLRGWEYAFSHINETAKLIYDKYNNKNLTIDELIFEAKKLKKLAYYDNANLGDIKLDKVQRIFDLYNVMGLTKKQISISQFVYNNKFNLFTKGEKAYIKNNKIVNICINENKNRTGILKDFINLIEKNSGFEFNIINSKDWNSSLSLLKTKQCDILPSSFKSLDLKQYFSFTKKYVDIPLVIATKHDVSFIDNIRSLKNKTIGVINDKNLISFLNKNYPSLKIQRVNSLDEGLDLVSHNKLFAQIDTITSISKKIQDKYLTKIKISGKLPKSLQMFFLLDKSNNFLLNILNKSIGYIDEYDKQKILNKWLSIQYKKSFDYSLLGKIFLAFIVIIGILIYRQRLLNNVNEVLKYKVNEKTKELIQLNESLERRIEQEVESNREKDRLLSQQIKLAAMGEMLENIAHQWRQPLSIISTTASGVEVQISANLLTNDELIKSMIIINETAQNLSKTIDDFRQFYEPNKKIVKFKAKDLYLKILNNVNTSYTSLDIKIIGDIEDIDIEGLDSELIQVILNILNNAKDALIMNNKNIEKLIFIDIKKKREKVFITIKDNAGGIKDEIIERVFEPYFTTKHKFQGTGIGLYMTREIIAKHMNGEITVKNKEYKYNQNSYTGAVFKITL